MTRRLSELHPGEKSYITALEDGKPLNRRLMDLGFTVGTPVRCLYRSLLGDPTAYALKGTVIALRREDASGVLTRERSDAPWA